MSVDTKNKCPGWYRESTNEVNSPEVQYILDGYSETGLADYGRYCILKHMIVQTYEGWIDVSDRRRLRSVARALGCDSADSCIEFLMMLSSAGAIDRECFEVAGRVSIPHLWSDIQSYQTQANASRRNGAKGGRPRKQPEAQTPEPEQPEAQTPEPEQPEAQTPEPEQPEAQTPEPEQPEVPCDAAPAESDPVGDGDAARVGRHHAAGPGDTTSTADARARTSDSPSPCRVPPFSAGQAALKSWLAQVEDAA